MFGTRITAECRFLAHFRQGAMSDLSPGCASNRTRALLIISVFGPSPPYAAAGNHVRPVPVIIIGPCLVPWPGHGSTFSSSTPGVGPCFDGGNASARSGKPSRVSGALPASIAAHAGAAHALHRHARWKVRAKAVGLYEFSRCSLKRLDE
jgi:hypothetical protein